MEPVPERCAGGIVLGDSGTIALVWSTNSKTWLFPKGHIDGDESDEDAARREILEETGLTDLDYIDDLGSFERAGYGDKAGKSVHMYLFAATQHATLSPSLEIEKAEWVPLPHVMQKLGEGEHQLWFAPDRAWFTTVFERVRQAVQRD